MEIELPIYYTAEYKTKPSKTFLVSMNWYRNAHYHLQNKVKQYYHELIAAKIPRNASQYNTFVLDIGLYYKNVNSDGSNICSMMEKFVLDALQELGIIPNDNIKFHKGTTWHVKAKDQENPRVVIKVIEVSENDA